MANNTVELDFKIKGLEKLEQLPKVLKKLEGKGRHSGFAVVKEGFEEVAESLEVVVTETDKATGTVKKSTKTLKEFSEETGKSVEALIKERKQLDQIEKIQKKGTGATKKSTRAKKENKEETDKLTSATKKQGKANEQTRVSLMEFNAGLEIAKKVMGGFRKVSNLATKGIEMFFDGFRRLDRLEELSTRTGTTVKLLSQLDVASRTAGVGMAGVAMATNQLSRFMYLASQGVKNQKRAFDDLGISVVDSVTGKLKPASAVLLEMAKIMPTIENDTIRTSLALSTMGRRGADMMSVLMGGAEGLSRSIELNRKLGLETNRFSAEIADAIDNNMTILSSVLDGVQSQLAIGFAPALRDLSNEFIYLLEDMNMADGGLREIGRTVGEFVRDQVRPAIETLRELSHIQLFADGQLTSEGKQLFEDFIEAWLLSLKAFAFEMGTIIAEGIKSGLSIFAPAVEDLARQAELTTVLPSFAAQMVMSDEDLQETTERAKRQIEHVQKELAELQEGPSMFGNILNAILPGRKEVEELVKTREIEAAKQELEGLIEAEATLKNVQRQRANELNTKEVSEFEQKRERLREEVRALNEASDARRDIASRDLDQLERSKQYASETRQAEIDEQIAQFHKEESINQQRENLIRTRAEVELDLHMAQVARDGETAAAHKQRQEHLKEEIKNLNEQIASVEKNADAKFRAENVLTSVQNEKRDALDAELRAQKLSNQAVREAIQIGADRIDSEELLAVVLDEHNARILLGIDLDKKLNSTEKEAIKIITELQLALREENRVRESNNFLLSEQQRLEEELGRQQIRIRVFEKAKKEAMGKREAMLLLNRELAKYTAQLRELTPEDAAVFVEMTAQIDEATDAASRLEGQLREIADVGQTISGAFNEGIKGSLMSILDGGDIGAVWKDAGKKLATNLFSQVIDEKLRFDAFFEGNILDLAAFAGENLFGEGGAFAEGGGGFTQLFSNPNAGKEVVPWDFAGPLTEDQVRATSPSQYAGRASLPIAAAGVIASFYDGPGKDPAQKLLTSAGLLATAAVGIEAAAGAGLISSGAAGTAGAALGGAAGAIGGAAGGVMIGGMIGDAIGQGNYYRDNSAQIGGMIGGGIGGAIGGVMAVTATTLIGALAATGVGIIAAAVLAIVFAIVGDALAHVPTAGTQVRDAIIDGVEANSEALAKYHERTGRDIHHELFGRGQHHDWEDPVDFQRRTGMLPTSGVTGRRTGQSQIYNARNVMAGTDYSRRAQYNRLEWAELSEEEIAGVLDEARAFGLTSGSTIFRGPNVEGLRGGGQDTFGTGRGEQSAAEAAMRSGLIYQRFYTNLLTELMADGYTLETAKIEAQALAKEMLAEKGITLGTSLLTSDDILYQAQAALRGEFDDDRMKRGGLTIDPDTGELIELGGMSIEQYRAMSGDMAEEMISMARGWETMFAEEIPKGLAGIDLLLSGLGEKSFLSEEEAIARVQKAIESGEKMNSEAAAQFLVDWTRSSEEAGKAIDKIFEVGDAQSGINQYIAGFGLELSTSIRAAIKENMLNERGGISGAFMPVSALIGATDFGDQASIQALRDQLPEKIVEAKNNLQEYLPFLQEQIKLEKELNDEIAIALGLTTREQLMLAEAVNEHGERRVAQYLRLVALMELELKFGKERAAQMVEEHERAMAVQSELEGMRVKVVQILSSIGDTLQSSLFSSVAQHLKNAIIEGAIQGMEGAGQYIVTQEDSEKAMMKAFGLAAIDALVQGSIQGLLVATGLQAEFEAAGEAMGRHIQGGIALARLDRERQEEELLHARTQERIDAENEIAKVEYINAINRAAQLHAEHEAIIATARQEFEIQLFTGQITGQRRDQAMAFLDAMQQAETDRYVNAAGNALSQLETIQDYLDAAQANEDARHARRLQQLDTFERLANTELEEGRQLFDEIMQGLPDKIRQVVTLLQESGLTDYISEIMDAFGVSLEDLGLTSTEVTDAVESAAESIRQTLDLRDYIAFVGGTALGEMGRVGGVLESGRQFVEPDENFDLSLNSAMMAGSGGVALNNNVVVEVDGEALVTANIKSTALADLANVPG